jgi:hypothetical protein
LAAIVRPPAPDLTHLEQRARVLAPRREFRHLGRRRAAPDPGPAARPPSAGAAARACIAAVGRPMVVIAVAAGDAEPGRRRPAGRGEAKGAGAWRWSPQRVGWSGVKERT